MSEFNEEEATASSGVSSAVKIETSNNDWSSLTSKKKRHATSFARTLDLITVLSTNRKLRSEFLTRGFNSRVIRKIFKDDVVLAYYTALDLQCGLFHTEEDIRGPASYEAESSDIDTMHIGNSQETTSCSGNKWHELWELFGRQGRVLIPVDEIDSGANDTEDSVSLFFSLSLTFLYCFYGMRPYNGIYEILTSVVSHTTAQNRVHFFDFEADYVCTQNKCIRSRIEHKLRNRIKSSENRHAVLVEKKKMLEAKNEVGFLAKQYLKIRIEHWKAKFKAKAYEKNYLEAKQKFCQHHQN